MQLLCASSVSSPVASSSAQVLANLAVPRVNPLGSGTLHARVQTQCRPTGQAQRLHMHSHSAYTAKLAVPRVNPLGSGIPHAGFQTQCHPTGQAQRLHMHSHSAYIMPVAHEGAQAVSLTPDGFQAPAAT